VAFASVGTIGHSGSKGSNRSTYALMTATNTFEPAPNDRVSCMILAILEHRKLIRNGDRIASKDLCAGQWVLSKWHDGWRRDASCAIDPAGQTQRAAARGQRGTNMREAINAIVYLLRRRMGRDLARIAHGFA
jgi:hypothetical protein